MAILDNYLIKYPFRNIDGDVTSPKQTIYETSATPQHAVGVKLEYSDGRVFRYARAGATNLSKCLMCTSEADEADTSEIVQTGYAHAVGETDITCLIVTGAVGAAARENDYVNGWMLCNKVAAVGDIYKIIASKRRASDDTLIDLKLASGIRTAITATTEITLKASIWQNTIVAATTITGCPCGVPLVDVTATYYYWSQVKGTCPILVDASDTVVVGEPAGKPGTNGTAGAVGVVADDGTDAIYGLVEWVGTAAEPALIHLNLE